MKSMDVLVIDEIGKISAATARPQHHRPTNSKGFEEVLDCKAVRPRLTEATHHNACGPSAADMTTRRVRMTPIWM